MKTVLGKNLIVAFLRLRYLRDELVRSNLNKLRNKVEGMKK